MEKEISVTMHWYKKQYYLTTERDKGEAHINVFWIIVFTWDIRNFINGALSCLERFLIYLFYLCCCLNAAMNSKRINEEDDTPL